MVATKEYRVVGTRPIRPDGVDKVTGRAQYGADISLPGLLHGRVKRSPWPHALIRKIDYSRAMALPGVRAVITAADFPGAGEGSFMGAEGESMSIRHMGLNVLAANKVLYHGHAVAAVCATDPHIAEDALDLIEVEYEVLPFVQDVREAMSAAAPVLHIDGFGASEPSAAEANVAAHHEFSHGDAAAGFRDADVVLEREFTTSMFHQGYIEPHNGTAFWARDGKLTIWCSTQGLFGVRSQTASLLRIPVSQINVIPMEIGGGFGGKTVVYLEPIAALLSKKSGRPVKVTMNRSEVLEATGPTSGSYMRVKMGAKRDGQITAAEVYLAFEAGAFPGSPVGAACMCALGPYDIQNYRIDGYDVVLNKPKTAAYRAPGAPAAAFAVEAVVNELARELQMDPVELRLKNAAHEGTRRVTGQTFGPIGDVAMLEAMKQHPHYLSELQGDNVGRGVALGFWFNGAGVRSVSITVNQDGTVGLVNGNVDIGGLRSSMAIMLAETLGIQHDDIKPHIVSTDDIGDTGTTGGSSSAQSIGWAVYEAGMELRNKLVNRAALIWEVDESQVTYGDDGVIRGPADSNGVPREMTFKELAARLPRTGGTVSVAATVQRPAPGPAFAGHIVDVQVDKETGKVTILRYTAFQDVGTAIHPAYVEGQVQGGAVQGIGMALTEEYVWDTSGRMVNASLLDYRMPTALDLPMIDTVLIEVPNPNHPYGVRGVGEVSIVPPMAAIQEAIADATGVRIYQMPISPKVLLEATLN